MSIATRSTVATVNDYRADFQRYYFAVHMAQERIDAMVDGQRRTRAHMVRLAYRVSREMPHYGSDRSASGINVSRFGTDFIPGDKSLDAKRREAGRYLTGLETALAAGLEAELDNLSADPSKELMDAANTAWDATAKSQKKRRDTDKGQDSDKGTGGGFSQSTTDEPGSGSPATQLGDKSENTPSGDALVEILKRAEAMMAELRAKGLAPTAEQSAKCRDLATQLLVFAA